MTKRIVVSPRIGLLDWTRIGLLIAVVCGIALPSGSVWGQDTNAAPKALPGAELAAQESEAPAAVDRLKYESTVRKALDYLRSSQAEDGSWSKQLSPAVTAMGATAMMQHGVPPTDPVVARAIGYVKQFVREDGGIYAPNSHLRNYETSVAVMCFVEANRNGQYDDLIRRAINFQKTIQWDEGEGHDRASTFYGGQGYGSHKRPDMSNTSFFMDALKAANEDPDSEAIKKALVFISRTQNLPGPHNDMEFATRATEDDRGGFIYTPVGEGETKVPDGRTPEGGLRSYASMTYAGLKSLLYAGVGRDDIRVQAARDWIRRHYDLASNPGLGQQGLYYYYHVFAKALDANGERLIEDVDGNRHNWPAELVEELARRQRSDGAWTNEADRWYEGDPNLVTAYCLMALRYCHPDRGQ